VTSGPQGLLLLPGQSFSVPLEASHIPTVRKNRVVEAHGQPEARETHERHKYIQNGVISSTPVTLSRGLGESSNGLLGVFVLPDFAYGCVSANSST